MSMVPLQLLETLRKFFHLTGLSNPTSFSSLFFVNSFINPCHGHLVYMFALSYIDANEASLTNPCHDPNVLRSMIC